MVAVAIGGAAILGAGATVAASSNNSKAISKSTQAQTQAQDRSLQAQIAANDRSIAAQGEQFNSSGQLQTDIRNQNVGVLNPFAQTGYAAMNQINALTGLPQQKAYTPEPITFTPVETQKPAPPNAMTIPAYARGTSFHPGGRALVGEEGPEVVDLPRGSRVFPNAMLPDFISRGFGNETRERINTPAPAPSSAATPQEKALNAFYDTQFYQFPLQQGLDAINANYGARGLLQSGAAIKALDKYASGVASGGFGDYLQTLGSQQALGANAASNIAGMNANYANSLTGLGTGYADAITGANNNLANAQGNYASNIGNINANAITANANNTNAMIGGIGSSLGNAAGYLAYQPYAGGGYPTNLLAGTPYG